MATWARHVWRVAGTAGAALGVAGCTASSSSSVALAEAPQTAPPAPVSRERLRVYDGRTGKRLERGLSAVLSALEDGPGVVLVGEAHDDAVAHEVEREVLLGALRGTVKVSLSLEMFERDVQHVMDEYLAGKATEEDLRKDARPWPNYEADYRPLVLAAKSAGANVVCANAPRRHAALVGREGAHALASLPEGSKAVLPPLPYAPASDALVRRLVGTVPAAGHAPEDGSDRAVCPHIGLSENANFLDAQALWDAAMAHAVVEELTRERLVVHVCGSFHVAHGLGVAERVRALAPGARIVSVTCHPADWAAADAAKPEDLAAAVMDVAGPQKPNDAAFVVLTDGSLPRSFDVAHPI